MNESTSFKEAYAVLQKYAQTLRSQQEPDIDNLPADLAAALESSPEEPRGRHEKP